MIGRTSARLSLTLVFAVLPVSIGLRAQQPPAPSAAPSPAPSQTAAEKYKNIQVLKDLPADQLPNAMEYIAASLGVQCGFCHVQTAEGFQYDSDDRAAKKTARQMIQMMNALNARDFEGRAIVNCATCHHGRGEPERTPPLAVEMTPEQVAAAQRLAQQRQAAAAQRGAQPGAAPSAPGQSQPPAGGRAGAPQGGADAQQNRRPPRPTETIDQVLDKYVQALGGQAALAQAKTRVMRGTATTRNLQSAPITVQETGAGQYRIDVESKPAPIVRASSGSGVWVQAFGSVHELEGIRAQQVTRLADLSLPLTIKQRYQNLTVSRYGNIDGTDTIIVAGRPAPDITEQLQFDRQTGLLMRRSIATRTALGQLPEQIDYSDYRDVKGVKVPFQVHYATWNEATTEKFTEVKLNVPVADSQFQAPSGK